MPAPKLHAYRNILESVGIWYVSSQQVGVNLEVFPEDAAEYFTS